MHDVHEGVISKLTLSRHALSATALWILVSLLCPSLTITAVAVISSFFLLQACLSVVLAEYLCVATVELSCCLCLHPANIMLFVCAHLRLPTEDSSDDENIPEISRFTRKSRSAPSS